MSEEAEWKDHQEKKQDAKKRRGTDASEEAGGDRAPSTDVSACPWRAHPSNPAGPPSDQLPRPWMSAFEPWQSFTFAVEHWVGLLVEIGADRTAQQELSLLAQDGEARATAANHIFSKILKKHADKEKVRSWSKFVHSCCKNARHQLEHQRWS